MGKVLVACEESQAVTMAFRSLGIEAYSCDLEPCSGGHPEWHIQDDVTPLLTESWDMVIAFPPCTHLAASGARWFPAKRADGRQQQAVDFFMRFTELSCPWAIENPVGIMSSHYRKPDQIIQPWQFGHDASKRTCLWLNSLPQLRWTKIVPPRGYQLVQSAADMLECPECGEPYCPECDAHYAECTCIGPTEDGVEYVDRDGFLFGTKSPVASKPLWANQTPSGRNKLGPSPTRGRERAVTYAGIAAAMAEQWCKPDNWKRWEAMR